LTPPTPTPNGSARKKTLAGIPADALAAARNAAEKDGKPGWKFTLHQPSYVPVLMYAENRDLRARMYRANAHPCLRVREKRNGTTRR
jgi:Zn-dependent oligopeptidase